MALDTSIYGMLNTQFPQFDPSNAMNQANMLQKLKAQQMEMQAAQAASQKANAIQELLGQSDFTPGGKVDTNTLAKIRGIDFDTYSKLATANQLMDKSVAETAKLQAETDAKESERMMKFEEAQHDAAGRAMEAYTSTKGSVGEKQAAAQKVWDQDFADLSEIAPKGHKMPRQFDPGVFSVASKDYLDRQEKRREQGFKEKIETGKLAVERGRLGVEQRRESREERAAKEKEAGGLTDEGAQFAVDRYLSGDTTAFQGYGRGTQGAKNLEKLNNLLAKTAAGRGITPDQLNSAKMGLAAETAEARTTGKLAGSMEYVIPTVRQAADNFRETQSALNVKVPSPVLNRFVQGGQFETGNPEITAALASADFLASEWAALKSRGTPKESDKAVTRKLIAPYLASGQVDALVAQIKKETDIAEKASAGRMGAVEGGRGGKGGGAPAGKEDPLGIR